MNRRSPRLLARFHTKKERAGEVEPSSRTDRSKATESAMPRPAPKKINLALQGGGAHGAFTWGVLDHLLTDGRLEITGISGTSAGAVNAVMIADGFARGNSDEARKRLADFWRGASTGGTLPPIQRAVADQMLTMLPFASGSVQNLLDMIGHYFSPTN